MTGDFINTNILNLNPSCHGCMGRGWVETSDRQPHKCPVCVGSGKYNGILQPINPWQPSVPQYPTYPVNPLGPVWITSGTDLSKIPLIGNSSNTLSIENGDENV